MPGPGSPPGFHGAYDDPARKEFQPEVGADPNVGRFYSEYSGLAFRVHSMSSAASIAPHHAITEIRLNGKHN